jgi:DNA transformation protein
MIQIADLPNFGPKSQQMLAQAGIHTIEQLRELGAVRAYLQVKRTGKVSLNLLWAMEGALTGRHWQDVANNDRLSLLMQLEDMERSFHQESLLPPRCQ